MILSIVIMARVFVEINETDDYNYSGKKFTFILLKYFEQETATIKRAKWEISRAPVGKRRTYP